MVSQVFFRLFSVAMLSSHKSTKRKEENMTFCNLSMTLSWVLQKIPYNSQELLGQMITLYDLQEDTFLHSHCTRERQRKENTIPRCAGFAYAKGKRTEAGHIIRSIQYCEECPEKPGLCLGECFRIYHTKIIQNNVLLK